MNSAKDVPTQGAIARDLWHLMEHLERWFALDLPALRALPSARTYDSANSREEGVEAAVAKRVRDLVQRGIRLTSHAPTRKALQALLNFDNPATPVGKRMEAAGDALDVGKEAIRKRRATNLLAECADAIYRSELTWCQHEIERLQDEVYHSLHKPWYQVTEVYEGFEVRDDDSLTIVTYSERVLRARATAQPIFVTWTDRVDRDFLEEIEVESGPREGPFRHRLLHARRADNSNRESVLIFDLGVPIEVDQEVTLRFKQTMTDNVESIAPVVGYNAATSERIRRLTLVAKVPSRFVERPQAGYARLIDSGLGPFALPIAQPEFTEPIDVDDEGVLSAEWEDVSGPYVFNVWWSDPAAWPSS